MRTVAWLGGLLLVSTIASGAATPDAKEIMVKQRALLSVTDETETLSMTIVAKNGDQKKRSVRRTTRTGPDGLSRTLVRFLAPRDVERTGVLTWENANGVDDQWMYLPAMKKVKRIASSGKKNRFMGTDFAYEDLRPESTEAHRPFFSGHRVYATAIP